MKITKIGQLTPEARAKAQRTRENVPPPMQQLSLAA